MKTRGEYSFAEIKSQSGSWHSAIDETMARSLQLTRLVRAYDGQRIFFIGCGSTHYLARFAAPYFQSITGMACLGVPSSELLLQTDTLLRSGESPLVVALSRSGETTETIRAAEAMRQRGSDVLTISCYDGTALAEMSTETVPITGGQEKSYAQTRSFAGMLVAVQMLAALVAGQEALVQELQTLPGLADDLIARCDEMARSVGQDESIKRITYLGSGPLYGLACEATVKMKEMSLSNAEAFRFMEFRHGPMALVDSEHLIVGLVSDRMQHYELQVLDDLRARGARLLVISEQAVEKGAGAMVFPIASDLSEHARSVLYLPMLQLLAYYRSMGRGLDPDRPRNVMMAIKLDGTKMT